jgi:hypothetical protein
MSKGLKMEIWVLKKIYFGLTEEDYKEEISGVYSSPVKAQKALNLAILNDKNLRQFEFHIESYFLDSKVDNGLWDSHVLDK